MSNKQLVKELRCLRMHLSPLLTDEFKNVLEEAEQRLVTGSVSTHPAPYSKHKVKKNYTQGKRSTKKQVFEKYFNK